MAMLLCLTTLHVWQGTRKVYIFENSFKNFIGIFRTVFETGFCSYRPLQEDVILKGLVKVCVFGPIQKEWRVLEDKRWMDAGG